MATHSSVLAWRIPWTEEAGGLQSMGSQESDTTERLNQHYPLYSCASTSVLLRGLRVFKQQELLKGCFYTRLAV